MKKLFDLYKNVFSILLFVFLFIGCTSNTIKKKPDNLISKNVMIDILTDMYIANAAYNVKNINEERQINYVGLVYEKYGVDSTVFSNSNLYYMSKIDEYEKMHKEVLERITNMRKEKEIEVKKADSIKNAGKNFDILK